MTHVYFKRFYLFGNRIYLSANPTNVCFKRIEMFANTTHVYFIRVKIFANTNHVYFNKVKLFANTTHVYFCIINLSANPISIYGRASPGFATAILVYFRLAGIIYRTGHINGRVKCFIGKPESIQNSLSNLFVEGGFTIAGNTNEYEIVSDTSAIAQKRLLCVRATKQYKLTLINK